MLKKPWWELWPGRLEYELDALSSAKCEFIRDEAAFKRGVLVLHLKFLHESETFLLRVEFPPLYPYFRPEVFAKPGSFNRHQNPLGGNLCLLGRNSQNWNLQWTLADLLQNQFPRLKRAAETANRTEREALEEPQGEPVTAYYHYEPNSILLIDSAKQIDSTVSSGELTLTIEPEFLPKIRGGILDARAPNGKIVFSFDALLHRGKQIRASWIRLQDPPPTDAPRAFEKILLEKRLIRPAQFTNQLNGWFIDIVGVLIPEEVQQGVIADGWMFLVRLKQDKTRDCRTELVRAGRAGSVDFNVRIPALAFLQNKRIAVIGLGSVGAPIALELARAGASSLSIIDFDFVEPGSTVRWPLGLSAAGSQKTIALKAFIERNHLFTAINAIEYRFGLPRVGLEVDLEKAISRADIIIDATAESAIHQFLSDYARKNKKPFVYAYLTPGAYGGLVACFDPTREMGCWHCLQMALYEEKSIPEPAFLNIADVQPPGCAERTAIFAGFDATEISLEATRMALSALSNGHEEQYPKCDWDVAVMKMRSDAGNRIPPSWVVHRLGINPRCALCR